jgi:DNA processing protein
MDKKFWVALSTSDKIGARTFSKLYKRFKKMERVWQASREELTSAGLDLGQVQAIEEIVVKVNPDKEMEKLVRLNIDILIFPDENYPLLLKEIPDPPGVLYVRGKIEPVDEVAIAVVGSRKYTSYGERATEKIVTPLAHQKITIISGLALGIDTLAHKAALAAGGRTIGVLGCGLDNIYPTTNIRLADQIIQDRGAIISEFPLGTPSYPSNFPIRNRIIAGLSLGTVVVEGAIESGSLITARAALDYNREVFSIPGSIFSETSEGPNRLIQMGAKAVLDAKDILTELNLNDNLAESEARLIIADTKEEEILLRLLKHPRLVDELITESKLPPPLVNATLIMLEMKGAVLNLGGTRYEMRGKLKEK